MERPPANAKLPFTAAFTLLDLIVLPYGYNGKPTDPTAAVAVLVLTFNLTLTVAATEPDMLKLTGL